MKRRTPLKADPAKQKEWQERSRKPLPPPEQQMSRTTPVKKRNEKRQKKREDEGRVYGPFFRFVKTLPCAVMGEGECYGPVTGHHLKTVGSGGEDAGNLAPLCQRHHRQIHDLGFARFNEKYFGDLRMMAEDLWHRYCEGFTDDT